MSSTSTILAACAVLCVIQPALLQTTTAEPDIYIRAQVNFDGNSKTPCIEFGGIVSLEADDGGRLNVPETALAGGSCSQNNTFLSLSWDEFMVVLFIKAQGALFYVHQVQLYAPDKTLFYHSFTQEDSPLTGADQGLLHCEGPVRIDLPKQKTVDDTPSPVSSTTTSTSTSTTVLPSISTGNTITNGPITIPTSPTPTGAGDSETSTISVTSETTTGTISISTVDATNGPVTLPNTPPTPQARVWSRTQDTRRYRTVILSKLTLRFNTIPTTHPPVQVDSCRREPDFAVLLIAAGALAGATVVSAIVVAVKLLPCSC